MDVLLGFALDHHLALELVAVLLRCQTRSWL